MSNPNATVDQVRGLSSPEELAVAGEGGVSIHAIRVSFGEGQTGLLDLKNPRSGVWAEVLESCRETGEPVYVEIDPETEAISELLIPIRVTVKSLTPADGEDIDYVELVISSARHVLRHDRPDYEELKRTLESARDDGTVVLVTEDDNHEIIDVRASTDPPVLATAEEPPQAPALTGTVVTLARAKGLFQLVNQQTCPPLTAAAPCIPFLYPDDGCWGRAHEMARLIIANGVQPEKVWIYGSLHVVTANKPDCNVYWGWHVAPTLSVNVGSKTETYVLDPSLFPEPVTQAKWAGAQGDPSPKLVATNASVFHRSYSGSVAYDSDYSKTKQVLATYRNKLKLRSAGPDGPPPYAKCKSKPTRVPLYRYWNLGCGDHFYTTNWGELGTGAHGWHLEGVQCYVYPSKRPGTVPLYRYWNPGGDHFYTTNWSELGTGAYGWHLEGIQCYVFTQALSDLSVEDFEATPSTFLLEKQGGAPGGIAMPQSLAVIPAAAEDYEQEGVPETFRTEAREGPIIGDTAAPASFQAAGAFFAAEAEKPEKRAIITININLKTEGEK